jgi:hypothetical protein
MRVEKGETKLTVDHNQGELTVLHPFLGPNTYRELQREAGSQGLKMATLPEAASVAHDAYVVDPKNQYSKEIQKTMENRWIYTATKSLWVPNKGVHVFPDDGSIELPEALGDRIGTISPNELEQFLALLEGHSDLVNFAEFGFDTGRLGSSLKLATNNYMKALAGQEGAEKLAEVSDKHKVKKPYLWAHQNVNEPLVTVSRLDSVRGFGIGLVIVGDGLGDNSISNAFGVRETGGAS